MRDEEDPPSSRDAREDPLREAVHVALVQGQPPGPEHARLVAVATHEFCDENSSGRPIMIKREIDSDSHIYPNVIKRY